MLVTKVTCPYCQAGLNAALEAVVGKKIKCLKCGERFRVSESGAGEPCRSGGNSHPGVQVAAPYAPPPGIQVATPIPVPPAGAVAAAFTLTPPRTEVGASAAAPMRLQAAPVATAFAPPPAPASSSRNRQVLLALGGLGALLLLGLGIAFAFGLGSGGPKTPAPSDDDAYVDVGPVPKHVAAGLKQERPPAHAAAPARQQGVPPAQGQKEAPPAQAQEAKSPPPAAEPAQPVVKARPPEAARPPQPLAFQVAKEQQDQINKAIDRGVAWVRSHQMPSASWDNGPFAVAYAALPGLTLLECGVPATDPAVVKAAKHVRFNVSAIKQHDTYQLSLAILFLDKLGDWRDRPLIQAMAMRLIAGQHDDGGWTYKCPVLSQPESSQLLVFLKTNRPAPLVDLIRKGGDAPNPNLIGVKPGGTLPTAIQDVNPFELPTLLDQSHNGRANAAEPDAPAKDPKLFPPAPPDRRHPDRDPKLINPLPEGKDPKQTATKPVGPNKKKPAADRPRPMQVAKLPPSLRKLPVVAGPGKQKLGRGSDNSNTQFAMMALWVARRHDVPMERTLYMIHKRFTTSQLPDGHWGYHYQAAGGSPAMTCVGLIGMAIGHGNTQEMLGGPGAPAPQIKQDQKAAVPSVNDPYIERGLRYLGAHVQNPIRRRGSTMVNLYFLWSIERVAVLYNLKTIGNKDWYGWASEMLVQNQKDDGSWWGGGYPGATPTVDTCLALLILRRANLVQDLTESLRLYLPITDPESTGNGSRK